MTAQKAEGSSEAYMRALTRAKVADIEYYLGSDWIDYQVLSIDTIVSIYRDEAISAYQPKKCPSCKKYWHETLGGENIKRPQHLPQSVFGGLPAEKEKCWMCN